MTSLAPGQSYDGDTISSILGNWWRFGMQVIGKSVFAAPISTEKCSLTNIKIPIIKVRQFYHCLIFIMGIPIPGRSSFSHCVSLAVSIPVDTKTTGGQWWMPSLDPVHVWRLFNSLAPERWSCNFKLVIFKVISSIDIWTFLVIQPSIECHKSSLMIGQHCFR